MGRTVTVYALALVGLLLLVVAWHRASHHRMLTPPTEYGPLWRSRVRAYWRDHGRYCHVCGYHGRRRRHQFHVHHRYGAGNHWAIGHEPDHALLGVCKRCHDRIHLKHRRLLRFGLDREPYKRLDNVTRRAVWLGVWRRVPPWRWRPG